MTNYIISSWGNLKLLEIVCLSVLDKKYIVISKALLLFLQVICNTLCEVPALLCFWFSQELKQFQCCLKLLLWSICDIFLHDLLSLATLKYWGGNLHVPQLKFLSSTASHFGFNKEFFWVEGFLLLVYRGIGFKSHLNYTMQLVFIHWYADD